MEEIDLAGALALEAVNAMRPDDVSDRVTLLALLFLVTGSLADIAATHPSPDAVLIPGRFLGWLHDDLKRHGLLRD